MARKVTPVKIFVAPEKLGQLVRDLADIHTKRAGLTSLVDYVENGMGVNVRPLWNPETPSDDFVVFLHPDYAKALVGDLTRDILTRRYAVDSEATK